MDEEILYNPANIANAIKAVAKERGVPLKTLLADCELGENTISHMRHGRSLASDSLARIADRLNCSVDLLLGRAAFSPSILTDELNAIYPWLSSAAQSQVVGYAHRLKELEDMRGQEPDAQE